jgi:hypothetical protein
MCFPTLVLVVSLGTPFLELLRRSAPRFPDGEMKVTLKAYHAASAGTGDLSILFKYYTAMVEFIHFILYFS